MFWFLFGIVAISGGIAAFIIRNRSRTNSQRNGIIAASVIAFILGIAIVVSTMVVTVSTKAVGIIVSYGRPVGTLDNGLHLIKPWEEVPELDAAIQTDSHVGTDRETPCTTVRIANSSTACVDNSVRWRLKHESADDLYRDYKDLHNIRDSLVTRELNSVLNEVYATYDPLKAVRDADTTGTPFLLDKLADEVASKLRVKVGAQIEILNVILGIIHLDGPTEERIKSYQVALADTRIAEQKAKTAEQEAKANAALAVGLSGNANVLVAGCMRTLDKMIDKGMSPPPGFNCWPGSGSTLLTQVK